MYFPRFKAIQFILSILLCSIAGPTLVAQEIPVDLDHPVYRFLEREITLGKINTLSLGMVPYTWAEINTAFDELERSLPASAAERQLLARYRNEFTVSNFDGGISGPWQKEHRKRLGSMIFTRNLMTAQPHFLTYSDGNVNGWIDWVEATRLESDGDHTRSFSIDQLTFHGTLGERLSLITRYTQHRLEYVPGFTPEFPPEYKQGFMLIHKETQWRIWDQNMATLRYSGKFLDAELGKYPLQWGFARHNSAILSGNAPAFPFVALHANYKAVRVMSLYGQLLSEMDPDREVDVAEKNISAHRIELDLSERLTFAFSEMVVYGRRGLELGYLIPITPYVTEEHQLGDRDNGLLALELSWLARPGIQLHGTFFMDDVSWFQIFDDWYGSKFLVQGGGHVVFSSNPGTPDLRFNVTAARPWVFTHGDSINLYTHADHLMGFPPGPNSRQVSLMSTFQPGTHTSIEIEYQRNWKGSGFGSDIHDDYDDRDTSLDEKTTWLMGDIEIWSDIELGVDYQLSPMISFQSRFQSDGRTSKQSFFLGTRFNW